MLGTGSVALSSVQVFGVASRRHPVTLTISTFFEDCAPCSNVARVATRIAGSIMGHILAGPRSLCVERCLRVLSTLGVLCVACNFSFLCAHDLEKTQVVLTFQRDGTFLLDVSNDPNWLRDRMQSIPGPFADRVVLWVDGREVRPESVDLIANGDTAVHRLRGHMPIDAKSLRWYYGLVIDPYPLTIHRADGGIVVEEIAAGAWSGPIDLSGQFRAPAWFNRGIAPMLFVVAILLVPPIVWLSRSRR